MSTGIEQDPSAGLNPFRHLLIPGEQWFHDRQPWLETQGYLLRPRYKPDWIPSWVGDPSIRPHHREDRQVYLVSSFPDVMNLRLTLIRECDGP